MTVTEPTMTRFLMSLEESVALVEHAFMHAQPGDLFVRKAPACTIESLACAVAELLGQPEAEIKVIGIRPGEKLHELLVTEDESRHAYEVDNGFIIMPEYPSWPLQTPQNARELPGGFEYSSGGNDWWLDVAELREMTADVKAVL